MEKLSQKQMTEQWERNRQMQAYKQMQQAQQAEEERSRLAAEQQQAAKQQAAQQAPAQQPAAQPATQPAATKYTPSASVTAAQQKLQNYEAQKPGEYQQSDAVTQAQQQLAQINANKPQSYNSKYGAALDNILAQIQNTKDFKFDFNGSELFKYYADLYTQQGKQASMDAMGQAAALTGGYGNSYAQQVGNQAYDQYLLNMYDKGMEIRDREYQKYQDDLSNLYNQFGVLSQQDQTDYGRYRDTVGDWQNERGYYNDLYNTERNFDYGKYRDSYGDYMNYLNYLNDAYNTERSFDYGNFSEQRAYDENVRQFNESLNWDKMNAQQKYAAEYVMQILAGGKMPSNALLEQAGLSKKDAKKLKESLASTGAAAGNFSGGGGGGGGGNGGDAGDGNTGGGNTSSKPKSLLGAIDGTTVAIQKQQTPEKVTPAGPINTNITAPAAPAPQKQTVEQILKNGINDVYKLRTKK